MNFINFLLTPWYYLYVLFFRLREKKYRYGIKYGYLPKEIDPDFLPVHMDLFWIRRGYFGINKCLVPKGNPFSARFNDTNPWFQSWVGTYYLDSLFRTKTTSEIEQVKQLGNAAIEDQDYWLLSYGIPHPKSHIIKNSIKKVTEKSLGKFSQKIFYGEMRSGIDDSSSNHFDFPLAHLGSVKIASIYNKHKVNPQLLLKDEHPSQAENVNLFGYFSIIEINPRKYLLTYVCGTLNNKPKISNELYAIISNIDIVCPHQPPRIQEIPFRNYR